MKRIDLTNIIDLAFNMNYTVKRNEIISVTIEKEGAMVVFKDLLTGTTHKRLAVPGPVSYPYKEGDHYWTIENGTITWSCWDDHSEELHDLYPSKQYFDTWEAARLSFGDMKPIDILVREVNTRLGSPMGRTSQGTKPEGVRIFDRKVPMCSDGAYDKGGAYWGIGPSELRVEYTKDLSFFHYYRKGDKI